MSKKNLNKNATPLIKQYLLIKKDYPDAILFFRLGDFYELFFDDAVAVAKLLELTLTKKAANVDIPMCGMPHHAVLPYIKKLVDNGYKVAIAEQLSEPGKGLVKREVVKVITPGQVIDGDILESNKNNYLAAISFLNLGYYLSYIDISTGDSYLKYPLSIEKVITELENINIKEVVLHQDFDKRLNTFFKDNNILVNNYSNNKIVNSNLLVNLTEKDEKHATSLLLNFLTDTQKIRLTHLMPFEILKDNVYLYLDSNFFSHMEIFKSNSNNQRDTLFYLLDQNKTAAGTRLLKHIMLNPLKDINILTKRHELISDLMSLSLIKDLQNELVGIYDLSRIVGRSNTNTITPIDLVWLKRSLFNVPKIKKILLKENKKSLKERADMLDENKDLFNLLDRAIIEKPEKNITKGGIIKKGFSKELDDLRKINDTNDKWLKDYEEEERKKLGVKTLKVGFNSVFGYYLEISKGVLKEIKIPDYYIRKQTLKTGERFITPKLKERETLILNIEEKINNLEYELFKKIREDVNKKTKSIQELAQNISYLDVFVSFSFTALKNNYVRPKLIKDNKLVIKDGRHPVVEHFTKIISNDVLLNKSEIKIITGPNMGGKSTYMRMVALNIYLALIGSFVSASSATIPLYDKIFTRIGANDNLTKGESTFMVEMLEAKNAITNASKDSILFFDEIGRGTATYDGMSLAYGILEYIAKEIKCQMFFSTHYHEITVLDKKYPNIKNIYVDATFNNDEIVFLYKVKDGSLSKSYGINVAKLAGMPSDVISIANSYLMALSSDSKVDKPLFLSEKKEKDESLSGIKYELKNIDLDKMTPLDALIFLKKWQDK